MAHRRVNNGHCQVHKGVSATFLGNSEEGWSSLKTKDPAWSLQGTEAANWTGNWRQGIGRGNLGSKLEALGTGGRKLGFACLTCPQSALDAPVLWRHDFGTRNQEQERSRKLGSKRKTGNLGQGSADRITGGRGLVPNSLSPVLCPKRRFHFMLPDSILQLCKPSCENL